MANNKSALKRVRQNRTRTMENRAIKSRVKSCRKAVLKALEDGNVEDAQLRLRDFSSVADRAAKGNLVHKNAAARLKSSLAEAVASRT